MARHYYLIKDKDGKTLFENTRNNCFAEFFGYTYSKSLIGDYPSDFVLEFLITESGLKFGDWQEFINKLGNILPKMTIEEVTTENFVHCLASKDLNKSSHKVVIKKSDYKSHNQFKTAVHAARTLIESDRIVTKFTESKPEGIDYLQWIKILYTLYPGDGHSCFGSLNDVFSFSSQPTENLVQEEYFEKLDKFDFQNCFGDLKKSLRAADRVITDKVTLTSLVEHSQAVYKKFHKIVDVVVPVVDAPAKPKRKRGVKKELVLA